MRVLEPFAISSNGKQVVVSQDDVDLITGALFVVTVRTVRGIALTGEVMRPEEDRRSEAGRKRNPCRRTLGAAVVERETINVIPSLQKWFSTKKYASYVYMNL